MSGADYDVIIAGGGMAGLITAASLGYHSKGKSRVLVIDRNKESEPGRKTNNGWALVILNYNSNLSQRTPIGKEISLFIMASRLAISQAV